MNKGLTTDACYLQIVIAAIMPNIEKCLKIQPNHGLLADKTLL